MRASKMCACAIKNRKFEGAKLMEHKCGHREKAVPEEKTALNSKKIPETRIKENNAAHIKGVSVDAQKIAQPHERV